MPLQMDWRQAGANSGVAEVSMNCCTRRVAAVTQA